MKVASAWDKALLCAELALDKKAYDLVLLDVAELTSAAEYFLICSGRSDTQVQAIAQNLQQGLGKHGKRPLAVEGLSRGQWVLVDCEDVVAHVFYQPVREFYDLEGLWLRAPRVELPEPYRTQALSLGTGTESF